MTRRVLQFLLPLLVVVVGVSGSIWLVPESSLSGPEWGEGSGAFREVDRWSGAEPIHLPKGGANLLPHGEPAKLDGDLTNRSGSARREDQSPG